MSNKSLPYHTIHDHGLTHGKRERELVSLYIKQVTIVIIQYTTLVSLRNE